nr:LOW QUALITY PROTEIN: enoyl-CoA delta isomerase 2-like [Cherax quadricarinatus]
MGSKVQGWCSSWITTMASPLLISTSYISTLCAGIRSFGSFSRHLPWTRTLKVMEHPARLTVGRIRTLSSNIEFSESAESDTKFVDSSKYEHLIITRQHGVRTITFNRPDKKNALNEKMFDEVVGALQDAASDPIPSSQLLQELVYVYCAGNDKVTAREALKLGLVTEVIPDANFPEDVWPKIYDMAKLPLNSLVYSKALMRNIHKDILHQCPASRDVLKIVVRGTHSISAPSLRTHEEMLSGPIAFEVTAREALKLGLVTEVIPDANFPEDVWPKIYDMAKLPLNSLVYSKALMRNIHKDILHQVNIEECKRVAERLIAAYQPGREDYQEFVDNNW